MDSYVNNMQNAVKTRSFRRVGILLAALALSGLFVVGLYSWGPEGKLPSIPSWGEIGIGGGAAGGVVPPPNADLDSDAPASEVSDAPQVPSDSIHRVDGNRVDLCGPQQNAAHQVFLKTLEKYSKLKDDKFTIAMQTYQRPKELKKTLDALLDEPIPSLGEVIIVWNDLEENPPADYTSKHGIRVHYRMSTRNSLNSRLHPDPDYKTQAILLTDDDVYYHPSDLEFVFQAWRKFGRNRLTGALARCSTVHDKNRLWKYGFCSKNADQNNYAMILTNLAFSHIAFMDYYSSDDPVVTKIRAYVDKGFNCEDIAMNFVQSYLTREGPLLVTGNDRYVNYEPKQGISRKPGHMEARSKCLNDFAEYFSCMPLLNETSHVQRGVVTL